MRASRRALVVVSMAAVLMAAGTLVAIPVQVDASVLPAGPLVTANGGGRVLPAVARQARAATTPVAVAVGHGRLGTAPGHRPAAGTATPLALHPSTLAGGLPPTTRAALAATTPVAVPKRAPVKTAVRAVPAVVRPRISPPACSDTWTGTAGDGLWSTPGNWSAGEPGSGSVACIPSGASVDPGTITVTVQALEIQTGGSVHVTPGSATALTGAVWVASGATLQVNGSDLCSGAQNATLTVTGDVTSSGTVELSHTGSCGSGTTTLAVASGSTLTSSGTLQIDGTTGPFALTGAFIAGGTVSDQVGATQVEGTAASLDVTGAMTVAAGASFAVDAGTTFTDDTGGSVTDTGTITSSGALVQGNGTETGNAVQVDGGSLAFTGTGTPAAYTVMPGAGATASGAIVAGVHLTVNAADNCSGAQPATLTFTADTTSAGTVELGHTGACPNGPGEVAVAAGKTLTSSGTLLIDGTTGPEVLQGAFVNTGTVSALTGSTQLQGSGSSFVNDGSMTVAASASFGVDAGTSFTNGDANATGPVSLADNGTFADAGTLTEGGGTTSGNQPLATGSLAYTGTGTSSIDVPPAATTALSGNLAAGQTLTVTGADLCGGASPGVANAAGSFTNDGTIELQHLGPAPPGRPPSPSRRATP